MGTAAERAAEVIDRAGREWLERCRNPYNPPEPLSIGARVDVYRRGIDYSTTYEGEYEVTHLYRYSNDCQPGDDYIAVCSPGTAHVTIVHQADFVPLVPTEWAAELRGV